MLISHLLPCRLLVSAHRSSSLCQSCKSARRLPCKEVWKIHLRNAVKENSRNNTHREPLPSRDEVCKWPKEDLARKQAGKPRMGAQPQVLPVGLLEAAREVLLTGATQTTAEPQQSAGVQDTTRKLTRSPSAFARTSRTLRLQRPTALSLSHIAALEHSRVRRIQRLHLPTLCTCASNSFHKASNLEFLD